MVGLYVAGMTNFFGRQDDDAESKFKKHQRSRLDGSKIPCFQWNRKVPKNFRHPWFAKEKFKLGELHLDWIGCVFVGTCFKS